MRGWLSVQTAPFPLLVELPPAIHRTKNTNIGPEGEVTMTFTGDGPTASDWRPRFTQKNAGVYVYGTIKYVDAFKIPRITNFRLHKGGDSGVSGPDLNFSTYDNEAN
jgi:hypothetical protein